MMWACRELGCSTTLIVSMGNDLYDGVTPAAVAEGLQQVLDMVENGHTIYGGSAAVWGYPRPGYPRPGSLLEDTWGKDVAEVCSLLNCKTGADELMGIETVDDIGHLHLNSAPQLCKAMIKWCTDIRDVPRARL